jgi:hypothetical protein
MIECAATIVINRSPRDVFRFVADVENIPRWVNGARVTKVSEGPVQESTLFRQGQALVRVSRFEADRCFETESVRIYFPARFVVKHSRGFVRCDQTGHATQLTLTHTFELTLLLRPLKHLISRKAQEESQAALEQLRGLLEHEGSATPSADG